MAKTTVVKHPDTKAERRAYADKLWTEVKANQKALSECVGPHDFVADIESSAVGKFRCKKCGGTAHATDVWWYKAGLQHGTKS